MTIKELRVSKGLTQNEVSVLTNIPLRTYKNYENDPLKIGTIKYNFIIDALSKIGNIDENHGIVSRNEIIKVCENAFNNFNVKLFYLFGSYATNEQLADDAINILIIGDISIKFSGIYEYFHDNLKKKINLFNIDELTHNTALLEEILEKGIKIVKESII